MGDIWVPLAYDACVIHATEIYYIIFGVLTFAGAIIGYAKARNLPWLIIGILTGGVLVTAGGLILYGQTNTIKIGLVLGLLAMATLSGLFIPKLMMNRAAPQVIVMAILSGVGMVLTLISFAK